MSEYEVLNLIDEIDSQEAFAEMNICHALMQSYFKMDMILEECDESSLCNFDLFNEYTLDPDYVQEGETWDKIKDAAKQSKLDAAKNINDEVQGGSSKLKAIIKSIPKFIALLIKRLREIIKGTTKKVTAQVAETTDQKIEKIKEAIDTNSSKVNNALSGLQEKLKKFNAEASTEGITVQYAEAGDVYDGLIEIDKESRALVEGRPFKFSKRVKDAANASKGKNPESVLKESFVDDMDDTEVYEESTATVSMNDNQSRRTRKTWWNYTKIIKWDDIDVYIHTNNQTVFDRYLKLLTEIHERMEQFTKAQRDVDRMRSQAKASARRSLLRR